jgi:hypothetical protein
MQFAIGNLQFANPNYNLQFAIRKSQNWDWQSAFFKSPEPPRGQRARAGAGWYWAMAHGFPAG